jgi:predicted patatin/cPLA2 family phospholipase
VSPGPTATIELLRARAARLSRPPHGDGASIALAVEGGAMRGVVSAGMVSALEALGLTHGFDAVYGSSAGALNAAYFLAGQAALGTTIYYEDINNRRFISRRRMFSGRPIVNLAFLIDDVARRRKPLAVDRVLASPSPLAVLATDVRSCAPVVLRRFASGDDLLDAMRAGATMPIVAGRPAVYLDRHCFDASLSEPIPVPTAESDGHSHVLVLLTRPRETPRRTTMFDRVYVLPRLRRISPALAERYVDRGRPYTALLERIAAGTGPLGRARVVGLRPDPPVVSKLERDPMRLKEAAARGYAAVMRAFQI